MQPKSCVRMGLPHCGNALPTIVFLLVIPPPRSAARQSIGSCTVNPHSMQDHRDLARQGDLRPFRTSPLGDVHSPALELREPRYARQRYVAAWGQLGWSRQRRGARQADDLRRAVSRLGSTTATHVRAVIFLFLIGSATKPLMLQRFSCRAFARRLIPENRQYQ